MPLRPAAVTTCGKAECNDKYGGGRVVVQQLPAHMELRRESAPMQHGDSDECSCGPDTIFDAYFVRRPQLVQRVESYVQDDALKPKVATM